jgi:hypothetical protein
LLNRKSSAGIGDNACAVFISELWDKQELQDKNNYNIIRKSICQRRDVRFMVKKMNMQKRW